MDTDGQVTGTAMFGEYALNFGNKLLALISDNKLFIRPTEAGRTYIQNVEAPPYQGAKPNFLIAEKPEDRAWLKKLVIITPKAVS